MINYVTHEGVVAVSVTHHVKSMAKTVTMGVCVSKIDLERVTTFRNRSYETVHK